MTQAHLQLYPACFSLDLSLQELSLTGLVYARLNESWLNSTLHGCCPWKHTATASPTAWDKSHPREAKATEKSCPMAKRQHLTHSSVSPNHDFDPVLAGFPDFWQGTHGLHCKSLDEQIRLLVRTVHGSWCLSKSSKSKMQRIATLQSEIQI